MGIPDPKLDNAEIARLQAPLELDLLAFFMVAKDEVLDVLQSSIDEGKSPSEVIDRIGMLFDDAGPRIEYAPEINKSAHRLAGRTTFQGLPISLEHRKGGIREGVDPNGNEWRTKMLLPYGYIRGTKGVDGDAVDCFIGDDESSDRVFVVHTYKPGSLEYDEDKVMLGFSSSVEARKWLEAHYDRYVVQSIDEIPMGEFKEILASGAGQRGEKLESLKSINKAVLTEAQAGQQVEMEHHIGIEGAKKIAADHLREDPEYYKKLQTAGLANELDPDDVIKSVEGFVASWNKAHSVHVSNKIENLRGIEKSLNSLLVQKAKGLPAGARRFWPSDGHWHRKLQGDKGWIDEYDGHISAAGANAKHRHQLESAGGGRAEDRPRREGQAQKEPGDNAPEPKGKPAAQPKKKKENTQERADRRMKEWIKDKPEEFHQKLVDAIHEQHPHPVFNKSDVRRKVEGLETEKKKKLAEEHGVMPEIAKPAGWHEMEYGDRINADKDAFIEDILNRRNLVGPARKNKKDQYERLRKDALIDRAKAYLGEDQVEQKRKKEEAAKNAAARAEKFKNILTKPESMLQPEKEKKILNADVVKFKPASGGCNGAQIVDMKTPSGAAVKGVWKAEAKERDDPGVNRYGNIPGKTQWVREHMGWELNHILGLDNHPAVVFRDVKGEGVGAMVEFKDGYKPLNEVLHGAGYKEFPKEEWQKIALHGFLACTCDGHGGNWMADVENKKLIVIDNGLAFPEQVEIGEWKGYRCNPHKKITDNGDLNLGEDIVNLMTPEKKQKIVEAFDKHGIGGIAKDIFSKRWDFVVKNKRLPSYEGYDFCTQLGGGY